MSETKIRCEVCPNNCLLEAGRTGKCRARKNADGKIVSGNYGQITSLALDPIEKKPLRQFMPGSKILSVGSYGCNLQCGFCQNHDISMVGEQDIRTIYLSPEELSQKAAGLRSQGNIGVAYTYNEPLIGYEYIRDTARIVQSMEMKNVVVSNGTANLWVLEELLPYIDAMNIDLKGFTQEFYDKVGGNLETVKESIRLAATHCHVELTTLIVPGENDSLEEMKEEAEWIASIDKNIVLHISRFFPEYQMLDKEATPISRIMDLAEVARKHLTYVYMGNC